MNTHQELPMIDEPETPDSPTRRRVMQLMIAGAACGYAGLIGYPVYRYLASPVEKAEAAGAVREVILSDALQLPTGSALIFKFGSAPALLIHHTDGSWVAFSAVCTHLGCTVAFEPENNRIYCGCHAGVYDPKTGANTGGPPPRPLDKYTVTVEPAGIKVTRS